jgi:hypothetical protein
MFEGLRSRWINSPECMYLMPLRTLHRTKFTGKEHSAYEHFPLYLHELLREDQFPWNQKLGKYLYCFQPLEC